MEDVNRLESHEGFCGLLKKALSRGLSGKGRRGLKKRWRKEKTRRVPSSSSIFRYLADFHDKDQEQQRRPGTAFIPEGNEALRGLCSGCSPLADYV